MKKILKRSLCALFAVSVAMSSIARLSLTEHIASAVQNGILQSDDFSAPTSAWETDGAYDRDFGDETFIDSVFFDASGVETTDGIKTASSALFYTQPLDTETGGVRFGLRLKQGTAAAVFGAANADNAAPDGAAELVFGTTALAFGDDTIEYGFDISELGADISVAFGDNAAVTVKCGKNEKLAEIALTAEITENKYFGFVFSKENGGAKGNLLYASLTDRNGNVTAGDSFTDERTVAPIGTSDAQGYLWKPIVDGDVGAGARVIRVVTGNELYVYNSGWPCEIAYTGYTLTGGEGSEYVISYDLTLLRSGWFGFVLNSNPVAAGERRINANTVTGGNRTFPAFRDGTLDDGVVFGSGDGSNLTGEPIAYAIGRKMHVTMRLRQTDESETALTMSFIYANDPSATVHGTEFVLRQAIAGQVAFAHSAEFLFSGLKIADASGKYLGGDDFSENGSYDKMKENWFIGLKSDSGNTAKTENFGVYTHGGTVFNEKTGAGSETSLISRNGIPAREGADTRDYMFTADLTVSAETLGDGYYSFCFGGETGGAISIFSDKITDGSDKEYPFAGESAEEYTLHFVAEATGKIKVTCGENSFEFDFGDEKAFVGTYGLRVCRSSEGKTKLSFADFTIRLEGVPSIPVIEIRKPAFVAVGEEIDLTPLFVGDELDKAEDMTLTVTVKDGSGKVTAAENCRAIFSEAGYYTVSYKLTNTHGLSTEAEFETRAVYRGKAENLANVVYTDFSNGTDGWKHNGSVSDGILKLGTEGKLTTDYNFIYFIADFEVKGGFEVVFGECRDYEHSFGISVSEDNTVKLRNLYYGADARETSISKDLRLGEDFASVRVKVIGGTATLYGRTASDPLVYYHLADFRFETDMPATYGKISLIASGNAEIRKAALYSLDSFVDIAPDDYDPADEMTGKHKKPLKGEKGCGSSMSGLTLLPLAVVSAIALRKKRRDDTGNGEKNSSSDGGIRK